MLSPIGYGDLEKKPRLLLLCRMLLIGLGKVYSSSVKWAYWSIYPTELWKSPSLFPNETILTNVEKLDRVVAFHLEWSSPTCPCGLPQFSFSALTHPFFFDRLPLFIPHKKHSSPPPSSSLLSFTLLFTILHGMCPCLKSQSFNW